MGAFMEFYVNLGSIPILARLHESGLIEPHTIL